MSVSNTSRVGRSIARADELAVIVISYNTREYLRACLSSVRDEKPDAVVVVDNASTDGSVDMVRREFPEVELIASDRNLGYGPAAGLAIAQSNAPFFLLLNSDARLLRGSIARMRDYLKENPQVGVAGPRVLNPDGSLQLSCFPFPGTWGWFLENDPFGLLVGKVPPLAGRLMRYSTPTQPVQVPWVLGAALGIRREAFEDVGGFDDSFFMYYEEVDLSYRMHQQGWETHHVPDSVVEHVGGVSTSQKRVSMLVQNFASTIRFYRKHYAGVRLNVWLGLLYAKMYYKYARDCIRLCLFRRTHARRQLEQDVAAWRRAIVSGAPEAGPSIPEPVPVRPMHPVS